MYLSLQVKHLLISYDFNKSWISMKDFSKAPKIYIFHENPTQFGA